LSDRKIYNVLIIGAGRIGAFFDYPDSERILTHAHAFAKHRGFYLAGFVDINIKKSHQAALIWGGRSFLNIEEVFKKEKIDIVSVAVPDEFHFEILKDLSQYPVKLIFLEKPISKSLSEAEEVIAIYNKKQVPVVVNYSRRFTPELTKLKNNIESNEYGGYVAGAGYYGKGILHNGSHLIDFLRFTIGEINEINVTNRIYDFDEDDPSVSAVLAFENGKQFFLQCLDSNLYTIFEMDLFFEKKRIQIKNSGFIILEYDIQNDEIFNGYKILTETGEIRTSLGDSLYFAAENIYDFLTQGKDLKCRLIDSYQSLKACVRIRDCRN
jgi:predicted dehydrogenase